MELLSDYEIDISYHEGKANIVADALSRRPVQDSVGMAALSVTPIDTRQRQLVGMIARLSIQPSIFEQIRAAQKEDKQLAQWLEQGVHSD